MVDSGDTIEGFVEEQEAALSFWGAPMTYDGSFPTENFIWIDKASSLGDDAWVFLARIKLMDWVIIPMERS